MYVPWVDDMAPPSFTFPGTPTDDMPINGKRKHKGQNGEHVPSVRLNEESQEVFDNLVERRVPVRSAIVCLMALQHDDEKKMMKFLRQYGGPLDTQALLAYIQTKQPDFTMPMRSTVDHADEIIEEYGRNAREN